MYFVVRISWPPLRIRTPDNLANSFPSRGITFDASSHVEALR